MTDTIIKGVWGNCSLFSLLRNGPAVLFKDDMRRVSAGTLLIAVET